MTTAASPSDPLGFDVYVAGDLDPTGRSATGLELVEAAIIHRLTCEKLYLTGAPGGDNEPVDFGLDVRTWVREATTNALLATKVPLVDEVLQRDERIASNDITLSLAPTGSDVDIIMAITTTTVTGQTLSRIIGISSVTVDFLAQGT